MKVLIASLFLILPINAAYAGADCARATQNASSIDQLVTMAASVGIIMSADAKKEYARCFGQQVKFRPKKRK